MARDKEQQSAPVVTSLPLPSSDNALVIDLPDGQKLLVGKMNHGTVIEIATWRGTGRPDSRTNRLMLGMSNSADENPADSSDSSEEEIDKRSPRYLLYLVIKGLNHFINLVKTIDLKTFVSKLRRKDLRNSSSKVSDQSGAEVQAWLESIRERSQTHISSSQTELRMASPVRKSPQTTKKASKTKKSANKSTKGSSKRA